LDIEKEQLKLENNQLKQVILQYQQRDLVASIQALTAAQNAAASAPDSALERTA
jgi:hypothetical protein